MAALTESVRVVVAGKLTGGEIFNWGLWGGPPAPIATQGDLQDIVNELVNTFVDGPLPTLRSLMDATCAYQTISGYYYPTAGSTSALFGAQGNIASADGTGTATTADHALQNSLVASLRSELPGRANRGRAYIPAVSCATNGQHQANPPVVTDLANDLADWCGVWQTNGAINLAPIVVSRTHATAYPLARIQVDTRFDVQRRRANRQTIFFTQSTVVPVG